MTSPKTELSTPYSVTDDTKAQFARDGYVKLKNILSAETLAHYEKLITDEVMRLYAAQQEENPSTESTTYERAFRQIMNIWVGNSAVKEFVTSTRLAHIARDLMSVEAVRLYHDQALYKMPHGGITPWHADQYYWPLGTDNTCTVWIPFQAVTPEMGPLSFSVGSNHLNLGRDLPISDESEREIQKQLSDADLPHHSTPYDLGEVSFHSGWTMHNAGENTTDAPRKVMTMIYFEDGATLTQPKNDNQQADWDSWLPGAVVGEVVNTPINPVL